LKAKGAIGLGASIKAPRKVSNSQKRSDHPKTKRLASDFCAPQGKALARLFF